MSEVPQLPAMRRARAALIPRQVMRAGRAARIPGLTVAAVAAALVVAAAPAGAASRSSPASCREALNGLISLLDSGKDDTPLYRDTYAVVVRTCGPARHSKTVPDPPRGRAACRDLAARMVDLIEDERMDSAAFVTARDTFAKACAPR